MVFRRDNKVDSFQRQMSALRNQLGTTGEELDAPGNEMPELDDEQFEGEAYRTQSSSADQDGGGYSFGNYPSQPQAGGYEQPEDESPAYPEIPATDALVSVIAADATWNGDITSENSIHVLGKVSGNVTAREDVWVAEGAEIDATINAQRIIVAGSVSGSVNASGRFEVLPSGQVSAEVTSPVSVVHEGARINGNFKVSGSGGTESRSSAATVVQRRARAGN